MVNNIKNNTIRKIDDKKDLNELDEIKNVKMIKYKKRTPGHKKVINWFNDLSDIILTDKTSENQENEKENEKVESRKEENKDYENENENEFEKEGDDDYYKNKNEDYENKNEGQIESLKELEDLNEYLPYKEYDDKELKSKYFRIQLADMSNEVGKELFEQIFGHKLSRWTNQYKKIKKKSK